jgi:LysR family glycine cleavage system transcriptional activator
MQSRLPPLKALRAFEAAARTCSFTRAAEELKVTQTAISHQVKVLEDWIGFRLFRRLNNALILTEKGELYLPTVREAFDRIRESTDELRGVDAGVVLTISALPNFALRWLMPRLPRFQARHPAIRIRLLTATRALEALYDEIDVAIRLDGEAAHLQFEPLFSGSMFPVMHPALLAPFDLKIPRERAWGLLYPRNIRKQKVELFRQWILEEADTAPKG